MLLFFSANKQLTGAHSVHINTPLGIFVAVEKGVKFNKAVVGENISLSVQFVTKTRINANTRLGMRLKGFDLTHASLELFCLLNSKNESVGIVMQKLGKALAIHNDVNESIDIIHVRDVLRVGVLEMAKENPHANGSKSTGYNIDNDALQKTARDHRLYTTSGSSGYH